MTRTDRRGIAAGCGAGGRGGGRRGRVRLFRGAGRVRGMSLGDAQTELIVYQGEGDVRLDVKTDGETVWLTQEQMAALFGRDQSVIARHISNVFSGGELPKQGYMQILHKPFPEGGRPVAIYNLDKVKGKR